MENRTNICHVDLRHTQTKKTIQDLTTRKTLWIYFSAASCLSVSFFWHLHPWQCFYTWPPWVAVFHTSRSEWQENQRKCKPYGLPSCMGLTQWDIWTRLDRNKKIFEIDLNGFRVAKPWYPGKGEHILGPFWIIPP